MDVQMGAGTARSPDAVERNREGGFYPMKSRLRSIVSGFSGSDCNRAASG